MNPMQEVVKQAMRAYHDHVEARFADVPIGAYLCVHDDDYKSDIRDSNDFKFTFVTESHILLGEEKCDKKVRKSVYGPKTEAMTK